MMHRENEQSWKLTVQQVQDALFCAWSLQSSSKWTQENPAAGHCGVTSLVVQDWLGGDIHRTSMENSWHYYNRIDGEILDFTASQFDRIPVYEHLESNREEAYSDTNAQQYQTLTERFELCIHALKRRAAL
ncbi:hypothetical protein Q5741_13955 [Paenibacillus sp. JX-17]|uniref:YunG n=1 Tax=Paenibacillus lacisoli TaxID=3064525 RepID=A0ABT9CF54_9BACL|nr:hypothetical protein [Paenibacillus sp. JX-17]MDO7907510.1 hypothetical protein [Paenibacillus sp. JX-17]